MPCWTPIDDQDVVPLSSLDDIDLDRLGVPNALRPGVQAELACLLALPEPEQLTRLHALAARPRLHIFTGDRANQAAASLVVSIHVLLRRLGLADENRVRVGRADIWFGAVRCAHLAQLDWFRSAQDSPLAGFFNLDPEEPSGLRRGVGALAILGASTYPVLPKQYPALVNLVTVRSLEDLVTAVAIGSLDGVLTDQIFPGLEKQISGNEASNRRSALANLTR